jgi:hypothetical protein
MAAHGCTVEGMLAQAVIYEKLAFDNSLPLEDRADAERLAATLRDGARQMNNFLSDSQRRANIERSTLHSLII